MNLSGESHKCFCAVAGGYLQDRDVEDIDIMIRWHNPSIEGFVAILEKMKFLNIKVKFSDLEKNAPEYNDAWGLVEAYVKWSDIVHHFILRPLDVKYVIQHRFPLSIQKRAWMPWGPHGYYYMEDDTEFAFSSGKIIVDTAIYNCEKYVSKYMEYYPDHIFLIDTISNHFMYVKDEEGLLYITDRTDISRSQPHDTRS